MLNFYDIISISHAQMRAVYCVLRSSDLANSTSTNVVIIYRWIWNG